MVESIKTKTRHFGGKLDNFTSKEERTHEQKHLKAYLRGNKRFQNGYHTNSAGLREPSWFNVKEEWK